MIKMIDCLDCKRPKLTWDDQREQFGRAKVYGLAGNKPPPP
jgi:hypothetical protein